MHNVHQPNPRTYNPPGHTRGFFFLRHGETTANRARICCGGEENPTLSERGLIQARAAGVLLRDYMDRRFADMRYSAAQSNDAPPLKIVTSPMIRTQSTAAIICEMMRLPVDRIRVEKNLIERKLGEWNGQCARTIQPRLRAGETPPRGESNAAFQSRILTVLRKLSPLYENWPLLIGSRGTGRIILEQVGDPNAPNVQNCELLKVTLRLSPTFEIDACARIGGVE